MYAWKQLRTVLALFTLLTLITGLIYPLVVTGLAQLIFPAQANGSLLIHQEKPVGSQLIGQLFESPDHFWGRPSATTPTAYNTLSSSGSNLGPSNPDLIKAVKERVEKLHAADPDNKGLIPVDLVTASGSGLDPHISPEAARYQISRLSKRLKISENDLEDLIMRHTEKRFLGLLGEPRVNVLELNLALSTSLRGYPRSNPGMDGGTGLLREYPRNDDQKELK